MLVYLLLCTLAISANYSFTEDNEIQKVRIAFKSPDGYTRHLLLGFTPDNAATDSFDYGYDARNIDTFPNDLNWLIDGERFIIQGVGEFATDKIYPLGLYLSTGGDISISLTDIENFEEEIPVYIYDSYSGKLTLLNESTFTGKMDPGEFTDRYFLTFSTDDFTLSDKEYSEDGFKIYFDKGTDLLNIKSNDASAIEKVEIFTLLGKRLLSLDNSSYHIQIPQLGKKSPILLVKIFSQNSVTVKKILVH